MPFPWPRRSKKGGSDKSTPTEALIKSSGVLRTIDEKSIVIDAPDGRTLEFQRTSKTKFYKGTQDMNASDLKPGDELSVESTEDQQGYLHAQNVYLEGHKAEAEKAETPASPMPPAPAPDKPPVVIGDEGDPGPPTLRRGIPPKRESTEVAHAEPVAVPPVQETLPSTDPLIEKARGAVATFSEKLPNYVCKEYMARFVSESRPVNWQAVDVVSTDIVYENGRENYRNVAVNGKLAHTEMEKLSGSWSTGEFATIMRDLLSPATAADFRLRSVSTASGLPAKVYDFDVQQANSYWHVHVASQSIEPAYKGSVWIEPESGRVLRIEIQARALPEQFPVDTVESAVDYANVRIAGKEFLLPAHAETLSCQRGSNNCSHNVIDFRNYHAYESDSSVTFASSNK